ncbi:hypothetical protein MSAN_00170800 [Mycena sanguinolenta]|uniref:Uncharacterized protein n=1 Tax=Mycena sanguinolenta TaxID=230812 RepID=A0A8H7DM73_9AGAR|nr:hypothetical protein MSAN_00170800 [Mycena sanguinolenta]
MNQETIRYETRRAETDRLPPFRRADPRHTTPRPLPRGASEDTPLPLPLPLVYILLLNAHACLRPAAPHRTPRPFVPTSRPVMNMTRARWQGRRAQGRINGARGRVDKTGAHARRPAPNARSMLGVTTPYPHSFLQVLES